jgi:group I intron endonuclease
MANGKFYIGSSLDVAHRVGRHLAMLRRARHENPKLQNCFNKYGEAAFVFELLEEAGESEIYHVEQKWIDKYWGSYLLMNLQQIAGRPPTFYELSVVVREKKRKKHQAKTGRKATPRLLEMLAQRVGPNNPNFGMTVPAEHLAKMRAALFASDKQWRSGEESPIFGLKRSPATRKAMSEAQRLRFANGAVNAKSKSCKRIDKQGEVVIFPSARAASAALGIGANTVARWCAGIRRPQDGSSWEYVNAS